ncbi:MAG: GGDEF domain-containing protein, partial [Gammaproteobacteria bacterium]
QYLFFNRNFLEEKGDEIFTKFKLQKIPVGVIMLDIDNFKRINDTYGHDVGDLVLKSLAETIKGILRKNDYIIRYGGEEFLILLPNATIDQAIKVAEKIRKEIENKKIKIGDKEIKFTVSLGVSEIYTSDRSLQNAIKRADEKLYKAKKKGKNRVEV